MPGHAGDLDDLRFLIRQLELESVSEIQKHVDRYYPDDVVSPENAAVLKALIQEARDE